MGIPFKYTIMLIIFDSEEQVFQSLPLINKLLTCMPYQFNSSTKLIAQKAFSKTSVCLKHDKLLVLILGTTISPIFHTLHYKQTSMTVLKLYNNFTCSGLIYNCVPTWLVWFVSSIRESKQIPKKYLKNTVW